MNHKRWPLALLLMMPTITTAHAEPASQKIIALQRVSKGTLTFVGNSGVLPYMSVRDLNTFDEGFYEPSWQAFAQAWTEGYWVRPPKMELRTSTELVGNCSVEVELMAAPVAATTGPEVKWAVNVLKRGEGCPDSPKSPIDFSGSSFVIIDAFSSKPLPFPFKGPPAPTPSGYDPFQCPDWVQDNCFDKDYSECTKLLDFISQQCTN